jgi:hypothetical protein
MVYVQVYRFVSKWDGQFIDTTKFTTLEERGGRTKTMLLEHIPDQPTEPYWTLYRDKRKYPHKEYRNEKGDMCVISMGLEATSFLVTSVPHLILSSTYLSICV